MNVDQSGNGGNVLKPPQWQSGGGIPPGGAETEHRLTALETRLDMLIPTLATKADIEGVKTQVEGVRVEISRWMLATVITIVAAMIAALVGIGNLSKPAPPQTIVVNPPPLPQPAPALPATPPPNAR